MNVPKRRKLVRKEYLLRLICLLNIFETKNKERPGYFSGQTISKHKKNVKTWCYWIGTKRDDCIFRGQSGTLEIHFVNMTPQLNDNQHIIIMRNNIFLKHIFNKRSTEKRRKWERRIWRRISRRREPSAEKEKARWVQFLNTLYD